MRLVKQEAQTSKLSDTVAIYGNSRTHVLPQVNFYTDHTKIILCKSSDDSYLLTYISRERVSYTYLLSMLTEMGCTSELRHRLRYIVQLLQHHADAWGRSSVPPSCLTSGRLGGRLTGQTPLLGQPDWLTEVCSKRLRSRVYRLDL